MPRSDFQFQFGQPQDDAAPNPDESRPLRILIVGDFSGTASTVAERQGIADRPLVAVDIDNLDQVLARFATALCLSSGEVVRFRTLDDFHPDQLVERLEQCKSLRNLRRRLQDPATFAAAAEEMRPASLHETPDDPAAKPQTAEPTAESDGDLFSRLFGTTDSPSVAQGDRCESRHRPLAVDP